MDLIPISPEYYDFVRLLRMHPETKGGFLEEANITSEQQVKYMEKYSENYFVCLSYDEPVGYVGVIDGDIRICTAPDHSCKGVGRFMLREIMCLFPHAAGKIKKDNIASKKLFDKCKVPYTII